MQYYLSELAQRDSTGHRSPLATPPPPPPPKPSSHSGHKDKSHSSSRHKDQKEKDRHSSKSRSADKYRERSPRKDHKASSKSPRKHSDSRSATSSATKGDACRALFPDSGAAKDKSPRPMVWASQDTATSLSSGQQSQPTQPSTVPRGVPPLGSGAIIQLEHELATPADVTALVSGSAPAPIPRTVTQAPVTRPSVARTTQALVAYSTAGQSHPAARQQPAAAGQPIPQVYVIPQAPWYQQQSYQGHPPPPQAPTATVTKEKVDIREITQAVIEQLASLPSFATQLKPPAPAGEPQQSVPPAPPKTQASTVAPQPAAPATQPKPPAITAAPPKPPLLPEGGFKAVVVPPPVVVTTPPPQDHRLQTMLSDAEGEGIHEDDGSSLASSFGDAPAAPTEPLQEIRTPVGSTLSESRSVVQDDLTDLPTDSPYHRLQDALAAATSLHTGQETMTPSTVDFSKLAAEPSAKLVLGFVQQILKDTYTWPEQAPKDVIQTDFQSLAEPKEPQYLMPPSTVLAQHWCRASAVLQGWSEAQRLAARKASREDQSGLYPYAPEAFTWPQEALPASTTVRSGTFLSVDSRLPSSAKGFQLTGTTRDSALRQFKYAVPSAKMPKHTEIPTEEIGKVQNVIRKSMVLTSRSGWVDAALVRALDALPVHADERVLDSATFSMLRAMLVDHARDHTAVAELLTNAYGNLQLAVRDQAISALKEAKPESTATAATSSKTPLAHVTEVDWLKLRTSALFTQDLFAQPQVDTLLEGVVAQDKRTVEMAAMVKTVTASAKSTSTRSTTKRKSTSKPTGAPPAKQVWGDYPASNTRFSPRKAPQKQESKKAKPPKRSQQNRSRGHSQRGRSKYKKS